MNIGILGTKIGMTQLFNETGAAVPVTVIQAGPCTVTSIKNVSKHGYEAIQIGYIEVSPRKLTKPLVKYFEKTDIAPLKYLKEYKTSQIKQYKVGDIITVEHFLKEQVVDVSGITIGKGFAGYQKRHNFSRGPMSHGSKNHREPGSIGAGTTPGRTLPRTKMAGHLGARKVSISKLKVLQIDSKDNILLIKGSIPGKPGNLVSISPS